MRWTRRKPSSHSKPFMGWLAAFHEHHDHGADRPGFGDDGMFLPQGPERFGKVIICDQCNSADGRAKRKLALPPDWSFSPDEIRQFVTPTPHGPHVIDYHAADAIYLASTIR